MTYSINLISVQRVRSLSFSLSLARTSRTMPNRQRLLWLLTRKQNSMIKASLENGRLRHQQPLTLKLTGQLTIQKNRLLHQNSSNLHQRLMQSSMNKGIALVFCRDPQGQAHLVAIKQALLKSVTPRNHFPQKQMRLKKNRARNLNSLKRKLIFQNQMNPKNPNSQSLKKRKPHRRGKTLLRSI